jgi:hypothetical protein
MHTTYDYVVQYIQYHIIQYLAFVKSRDRSPRPPANREEPTHPFMSWHELLVDDTLETQIGPIPSLIRVVSALPFVSSHKFEDYH